MYIHWDKSLETGQPLLDAEHRILVMLFRKLDIAIKTKQSESTLNRIVSEVRKFTDFHFLSEENVMYEIGYPDFDAHCKLHADLIKELNEKISRVVSHKEFPEDLLYFLNQWLIVHIAEHDQQLVKYINTSDKRPVAEEIYFDYLTK